MEGNMFPTEFGAVLQSMVCVAPSDFKFMIFNFSSNEDVPMTVAPDATAICQ
ncbi:hypothetical protein TRAPUB_2406 [Trametes pubescens]|uniref:Uncharacterized protein n=1 Tax=Trametes pubescens TaxID=154538 RepID=A0A1M2VGM5_TRAPU|nr:hypothetical protein TRAPUB_2406 [Trametes pubescens]